MRKGKMRAAEAKRRKIVHHTPSERLAMTRRKRKEGPSGKRRAERRKTLQPVRHTLAEYAAIAGIDERMQEFQDHYAQMIAIGDPFPTMMQTLDQWRNCYEAWREKLMTPVPMDEDDRQLLREANHDLDSGEAERLIQRSEADDAECIAQGCAENVHAPGCSQWEAQITDEPVRGRGFGEVE